VQSTSYEFVSVETR